MASNFWIVMYILRENERWSGRNPRIHVNRKDKGIGRGKKREKENWRDRRKKKETVLSEKRRVNMAQLIVYKLILWRMNWKLVSVWILFKPCKKNELSLLFCFSSVVAKIHPILTRFSSRAAPSTESKPGVVFLLKVGWNKY